MVEDPLFFSQYGFHRQKIAFHRASMSAYKERLIKKGHEVHYLDASGKYSGTSGLFDWMKKEGINKISLCDPVDYLAMRRINRHALRTGISIEVMDSPQFLCSSSYGRSYFKNKRRFFLTEFYIEQRKRFNILMEGEDPLGGKWTFDTENRKKLPAGTIIPALPFVKSTPLISKAIKSTSREYVNNPGSCERLYYPSTHKEASDWLDHFLEHRFRHYGVYQDAIVPKETFLFHSVITPMLNTGLLLPGDILQRAVEAAFEYKVPLNSLEGFVRQILGWREFLRIVYDLKGVEQRTRNFWNHTRKIPHSFYEGTTGIPPVDDAIARLLKTGYNHHIERLMVLGNFMVLCEFDPDEVYRWFMELYIDAYDWVMVPNVYGMSQFADGGLMSTKPYISGSNYLLKMSNYPKGPWCEIWDALYWRFIHLHKGFFLRNPRMSMMVRLVERMEKNKFSHLMNTAEKYLSTL